MDKNQIKKIAKKETLVMGAFILIGALGHLFSRYLYNYYVYCFPSRSDAPYSVVLRGWWFLILIGYFLSILARHD